MEPEPKYTRKQIREAMMPVIGSKIGECIVNYVNTSKFRFTAEGDVLPVIGTMFESDGRIYEVDYINEEKKRCGCVFKGFKQNPVIEAPVEEDVVKVI